MILLYLRNKELRKTTDRNAGVFYGHFEGGGAYDCAQIKLIQQGNRRQNGSPCKKDRWSLRKEPSEGKT